MAKRYRPVGRDQGFVLPPDMRDWLPADHPVHLVIRVVEQHLETTAFHALRRTGGAGTAGYDPDMLVTVLVWAYAHQVTSSRRIEQLCGTDVAFRLICAGSLPDHATIARFRAAFPGPAAELLAQVLGLCARLGMGRLGVVALDGTKVAASAGKAANRTGDKLAQMAAETVARHGQTDAAEDGLFGDGNRGDEVPPRAWSPRDRDSRIAAALASLQAEQDDDAAERKKTEDEHLAGAAAGTPRRGSRPAGADVALAEMAVERGQGRLPGQDRRPAGPRGGRRPEPARRPAGPARPVRAGPRGRSEAGAGPAAAGRRRGPGRGKGAQPPGTRPGPQHHRPRLAADAGPRRRVHPGLQRPGRHQLRRADHRHRAHRHHRRHHLVHADAAGRAGRRRAHHRPPPAPQPRSRQRQRLR